MKTNASILSFLLNLAFAAIASGKTIPNFAEADLVIGQPNFVTNVPSALSRPFGVVIDPVYRKVFVSDLDRHRVLRYPSADSLTNGAVPEMVFGQPNMSTFTEGTGRSGMRLPVGLFFDARGSLWVCDGGNSRVLMFEAASSRTSTAADKVFGQPDFIDGSKGLDRNFMSVPTGVCVDSADRLWVADQDNQRVLRFDNISQKPSSADADGVLGQVGYLSDRVGSGSTGMNGPSSVTVNSSGTLFVADSENNRVLRFDNAANLPNGAAASAVLGQPNFTSVSPAVSATQMDGTTGVFVTPDETLWVCDASNHRLLRFDRAFAKLSGSAADGVLGQSDFTSKISGVTSRKLFLPQYQPFVDAAGSLWMTDALNNRVLRFPADTTPPLLAVTSKFKKTTTQKAITFEGIASDTNGISKVEYRGKKGSLKTAAGTNTWKFKTKLKKGKNKITVFATDSVGNVSVNRTLVIQRK